MIFLTILGVTEIVCSFKLVLEGKTGKVIPESSGLEFVERFSANNFTLSDTEDNTSGPLNRGGIADLPLLRTLLAIRQKSRQPSFWEVSSKFFSEFLDSTNSDYNFKKNKLLINHILLIFKLYVYRSREKHISNLIAEIKSAKVIEKEIATSNSKKTIAFKNKWHITNDIT